MPVSSYVIRCALERRAEVIRSLRALPGIEVGEDCDAGLAVATDTLDTRAAEELGEQLQRLPGVHSAVLVYHNFEDVAGETAALPWTFRS
jgi:nitrate reductase NapAB chaperone NapD